MAEGTKVGGVYYDVSLDTGKLLTESRAVNQQIDKLAQQGDKAQFSLNVLARAAATLASALVAVKTLQRADEFRLLGARVEIAAGNVESGAAAFAELVAISRRTQTSLEGNIEVFTRLNQSIVQMGGNQADTLRMTELLGKAIKVSGASAVESKAAMLQFGQALGSGKLGGDELRSLLENAPYLMRQLADSIGVPVGELRKLGEEGKLTADVVAKALFDAATRIERDFKKVPQTISDALTVAADSAALAILKFDELTGSSAAMAGVLKGAGEVLDKLADQFAGANDKAGELGRNEAVRSWADTARIALSYVVDAADLTWQTLSVLGRNVAFTFGQMTADVKASAQAFVAMQKWEFTEAQRIMDQRAQAAAAARKALDEQDAKTLARTKLAGQQMREAWEQGAGGGRGWVNPANAIGAGGKLKGAGGDDKKGAKFDAAAYLAGLAKDAAEGYAKIDTVEREALRKNAQLLEQKKITQDQARQAERLIMEAAAQDRKELAQRNLDQLIRSIEEEDRAKLQAEARRQQGRSFAQDVTAEGDPIARLVLEQERKTALLAQFAAQDQANALLYAEAKVALERQTQERITEILKQEEEKRRAAQSAQLQGYANLFSGMADLAKTFGGEQSKTYKAMFAVSKAFAIADSIIKIQQGIAAAAALPFPTNIPAMATVAAQTAGIISTIRGQQFGGGRQYGGPVSAGTLYKVNETGRPEMFTGSNGSQYMLPTRSGSVTPADEVGGGGGWRVIINNAPPGTTASVDESARVIEVAVARAEAAVAESLANNTGKVWAAARAGTNIRPRLG